MIPLFGNERARDAALGQLRGNVELPRLPCAWATSIDQRQAATRVHIEGARRVILAAQ